MDFPLINKDGTFIVTNNGEPIISKNNTTASGGTETTVGAYKVHTFTSSGTFTVTKGGLVDLLLVGGGGGGGRVYNYGTQVNDPSHTWGTFHGGGGGGGEVVSRSLFTVEPGTYSITVGDGGSYEQQV